MFLLQMGVTKLIFTELVKNSWFSLAQSFEIIKSKHPRNDRVSEEDVREYNPVLHAKPGSAECSADLETLLHF